MALYRKKIIATVFFLCLFRYGYSQASSYNITILDSTETFYTKLQAEIKNREPGVFSNTAYDSVAKMVVITKYTNYIPKGQLGNTWTTIQREKYDEKNRLQQEEFWKTDNNGMICRCGSWQLRTKGIWVVKVPYPSCSSKKFSCGIDGKEIKNR